MPLAIVVHGGAGTAAPDRYEILRAGCKEAVMAGWIILQAGGTALDAVEAAVRSLEDNPNFNAGTGASLNTEGNIELDAGIMAGSRLAVGAVADVELIKNPISLARRVLESPHVLLVGKGAQQFAREQGIPQCSLDDLMTQRQYEIWKAAKVASETKEPRYHRREVGSVPKSPSQEQEQPEQKHGTVGAVALDTFGDLAAATSTGGILNKYPGRIGDSPLVGCGFYADENAAVSCTGHGEDFVRLLIARRTADFVARGDTARAAAEAAIAVLSAKATGEGGLIVVDHLGNVGFAWNTKNMSYAYMVEGMPEAQSGL